MEVYDNVEKIPLDKLLPYHNNPKEHPPDQIEKIKKSIKEYGFTVPLIIDGENEIIAGHGRLEAAKKLGMKKLPCIKRDDLTEKQIQAFRIADNKVAESDWNMEQLATEFEILGKDDFTGFDIEEIEDIIQKPEPLNLNNENNEKTEKEIYSCPKCGFEFEV